MIFADGFLSGGLHEPVGMEAGARDDEAGLELAGGSAGDPLVGGERQFRHAGVGLAYAAHLVRMPMQWIIVGAVVMVGIGILSGVKATRPRDSARYCIERRSRRRHGAFSLRSPILELRS